MSYIVICGKPNSELTSECIILADNLSQNVPSFKYMKVLKHPEEWEKYSEDVCNLFGFTKNPHPLIFCSHGQMIGGKEEFFSYIEKNYNNILKPDSKLVYNLTIENLTFVYKNYEIKQKGPKLIDKLDRVLSDLDMDSKYNTLDEDYNEDYMGGIKVFYKYNKIYTPQRNEWTFHNELYEDKIVEILLPDSDKIEINEEEDIENTTELQSVPKKKVIEYKVLKNFPVEEKIYDKKYFIEQFPQNYQIIVNPSFTFYGEVLIHHNVSDTLKVRDFGKIPNIRPIIYDDEVLMHANIEKVLNISNLETNVINFDDRLVLSDFDITYLVDSVKELNGLGMVKILPANFYEYKDFSTSKIRIIKLPIKDLKYEEIPLTEKLRQILRDSRRERLISVFDKVTENKLNYILDNSLFNECLDTNEFFKIENYDFPHLVKMYTINTFNAITITTDMNYMIKILSINNFSQKGMILLLTNEYLFIAPLCKPYTMYNNIPIFVEPYFYAGIFTLPEIEAEWPHILKADHVIFNYSDILKLSST